jgi:cytochrome c peroxidase
MQTNAIPAATRTGGRDTRFLASGLAGLLLAALLTACGGGGSAIGAAAASTAVLSAQAELGRLIFNDSSLSASGQQACATCHDESTGHAAPNGLPAQLGGPAMNLQGGRNAPSLRYLARNQAFRFASDGTPQGGFFWDGRATSLQDQAAKPFFNPVEMANANVAELVGRLARAAYAAQFRLVFGDDIFSRPDEALASATLALARYQLEDPKFQPYSSKYDEFLRGNTSLSDAEQRGLAWFNAPAKGNCAACHPSARAADGSLPLFTDFTYDNLGVPRNAGLQQNHDPAFFDLGLCAVPGLGRRTDLCGAFKVPSLRNVAVRGAFFHNGRFATLKEALQFYVQRDTAPQRWYPMRADGTVDKFNDLPPALRGNVNTTEAPYNRQPGDASALSDAEIDDVIAFLHTLTDAPTR